MDNIKKIKKENKGLSSLAQRLVNMCKEVDSSYKPLYPLGVEDKKYQKN